MKNCVLTVVQPRHVPWEGAGVGSVAVGEAGLQPGLLHTWLEGGERRGHVPVVPKYSHLLGPGAGRAGHVSMTRL